MINKVDLNNYILYYLTLMGCFQNKNRKLFNYKIYDKQSNY